MRIDFEEAAFLHIFVTFIFEINVFQCATYYLTTMTHRIIIKSLLWLNSIIRTWNTIKDSCQDPTRSCQHLNLGDFAWLGEPWIQGVKAKHCWSLTTNSFFVFFSIYVKLIECKTWLRKTCNKSFLSSLAEWELKFEFLYTYWILTIFPKRNNGPLNFNSNSNSTSELIWTSCILLT